MKPHCRNKLPALITLYQRYLSDEDCAGFIRSVSFRYTICTLERLAEFGDRVTRRAAVMALGYLADFRSNNVLGRRLCDADRAVRVLAENGIVQVWLRYGSESQQQTLKRIIRLNASNEFLQAQDSADQLIVQAPGFAEAWNQRAVARFGLGDFEASIDDCRQSLKLNPYHFAAAAGMGRCHLELNDGFTALECFQHAVALNPALDGVRAQVKYLQRVLKQ